jgi:hypothetical protein
MEKLDVEELVRAAVAAAVEHRSPWQITLETSLSELGYGDAGAYELTIRLFRAVPRKKAATLASFARDLNITPASTVGSIVGSLRNLLPERLSASSKLSLTRQREVEAAVLAAVSEKASKADFARLRPEMKLGELGLDELAIADVKISVFRTLGGSDFPRFNKDVIVDPTSTVRSTADKMAMALLPGNDPTKVKG